ncbi:diguanylate cyclase domain protein [Clostridiales bacterium oral taxon 876 str. F0540]|nr:diguanylate cyclase domain protein [Clostridiales bacterium oral taxon 876 str. F0540]
MAFFINRRGFHSYAVVLAICEVVGHSTLAVMFLGWASGFHYYILCLVPLLFFSKDITKTGKVILNILFCVIYIVLRYYASENSAIVTLNTKTLNVFDNYNIIVTFSSLSFLAYYYCMAVEKAHNKLRRANKKLEILADTDPLTGLLNRRKIVEEINKNIVEFKSTGKSFVLIMADIDNFKSFNDKYGHNCGDLVVTTSGAIMKSQLINEGIISRWGGEEFLILLPSCNIEGGKELAEKLRKSVQDTTVIYKDTRVSITMTFGVCSYISNINIEEAIGNADKALYEGKRKGRNCVVA